jgi:hypothetical protein
MGSRRVKEGDQTAPRPRSRALIDQTLPAGPRLGERLHQIGHQEREVVESLAAALEESEHRAIVPRRLEQLQEGPTGIEEGDVDLVVGQVVPFGDHGAKRPCVEADGGLKIGDGDPDVVKVHRLSPQSSRSTRSPRSIPVPVWFWTVKTVKTVETVETH